MLFFIWSIRKYYKNTKDSIHKSEPIRALARKLYADFIKRYEIYPDSKLLYISESPKIGKMIRYVTIHPFTFYSVFLDPCTKNNLKVIMHDDRYKQLLQDIKSEMISIEPLNQIEETRHEQINNVLVREDASRQPSAYDMLQQEEILSV